MQNSSRSSLAATSLIDLKFLEAEHHFGSVEYQEFPGRDPLYEPKPSYRAALTDESLAKCYRANAEGDANVAAEQSLSLAPPPDGPSPGGGPTLKLTYRFDPGWKFINVTALEELKKWLLHKIYGGLVRFPAFLRSFISLHFHAWAAPTFAGSSASTTSSGRSRV